MPHAYPTPEHAEAADIIVAHFRDIADVDAVLLTCSCARGKACPDSCLDVAVLVQPRADVGAMDKDWEQFCEAKPFFVKFRTVGLFTDVHLDIINGRFNPTARQWTSGPDSFELEVGNYIAYSVPLWQRNDRYENVRAQWMPYYSDELRAERLAAARKYCLNNLAHIPPYVGRGLYFQAFNRFYDAYREFLQATFIARRTYPIAYDKWIREQVEEILGLPQLYAELPRLFEIAHFESSEIALKAEWLGKLLELYAPAETAP